MTNARAPKVARGCPAPHSKGGVWPTVAMLGVLVVAGPPTIRAQQGTGATPPAAYKAGDGPFSVGVIEQIELSRGQGTDPLPVLVRYPHATRDASGPFPLVIFSHGGGGFGGDFAVLSRHWASHGYIVVHPTHPDSVRLRRAHGEDLRPMRRDPRLLLKSVSLAQRRADIELILDALERIEAEINRHARKAAGPGDRRPGVRIDRKRIALAGHSAGAMTAQALAGVRLHVGRRVISLKDDRIRAAILISGQGVWRRSLRKDSWKDIRIPMLVITGSRDTAPITGETPETRQDPFRYAPPGDKFLLFIDGATHFSYAHKMHDPWHSQPPPENPDYITSVVSFSTLAFLDAYLDDAPSARAYLRSRAITRFPGGKVRFETR